MGVGFQEDPASPSSGWEEASSPSSPSRPSTFAPPSSDTPAPLSLCPLLQSFLSPLLLVLCLSSSSITLRPSLHHVPSRPPHLRAPGCIPAELSLRGSAAPPSGQSRDRRGVSHTRKTRVVLCRLRKTQRCPPTWPAPSAPLCPPQPRVWLLWVDAGINTSPASVSPNNPNYQASSSPKDQTTELMCLIAEFLPLHSPVPWSAPA